MQAENDQQLINDHKYFQLFVKNHPRACNIINALDINDASSAESYNKFVKFYSDQNNINAFKKIMRKIYDPENKTFIEHKLIEFLNEYNKDPSYLNFDLNYMINNAGPAPYGSLYIMEKNKSNLTENEKKALDTYNNCNNITRLLVKMKKVKTGQMNSEKKIITLEDLKIDPLNIEPCYIQK